jgi:hypothetical protein
VEDAEAAARLAQWRERVPRPVAAAPGQPTWVTVEGDAGAWFLHVHLAADSRTPDVFFDSHPVFAISRPAGLRARMTPRDATAPSPARAEFSWVVAGWDARQTVELDPSPRRGAHSPRWPIVAGAAILLLALVVVVLGRKSA